jgi:hypothetical protein
MKVSKDSLMEGFKKYGELHFIEVQYDIQFRNQRCPNAGANFVPYPQENVPDEWIMRTKDGRLALPKETSVRLELSPMGFQALKAKLKAAFQCPTAEGRIPKPTYHDKHLNASSTWADYEAAVMENFSRVEKKTKAHLAKLNQQAKDHKNALAMIFS